ncbi:MAG: metallophosphoesterase [Faecousia sp.]
MRFLHISDCHFGFEKSTDAQAQRDNYMESLLQQVREIAADTPVDYLFITGDIGWKAQSADYDVALMYIKKLIEACCLDTQHVFVCPGNHDVDRNAIADKAFPNEQCEANAWLTVERLDRYLTPGFSNYIEFCKKLELPQYQIGEHGNYLVGIAETSDLRVISLNSSWYAQSDAVKDNMWIGANFLQVIQQDTRRAQQAMENEIDKHQGSEKLTVALIHHPSSKWHEDETANLPGKVNVLRELCSMSDIILTGHTHEISCDLWYHEGTVITGTGAVYNDHTYNNSFYVYDLTPSCPERTQFYLFANRWARGKAEMLRGYRLDSKLQVNNQSKAVDSGVFSQQEFDRAVSAISFESVDECVKKWFLQDISHGYPVYRNIQSNERVLRFLKQFVFYENKEALIDDLFDKCIEQIRNNEVVVLRGAQGTGKSTVISLLYIATLNSYRNGELDAYPLYVDIHKYMIADRLGNMGDFCDDLSKLASLLEKNGENQKYVVFIDGIDEYVSGSEEYESEIYNKIVRNYQDKIVLCIGTIEDVGQNRLAVSQFQNFIDQDSIIIETRAAQVQVEKIDELVARVAGAFEQKLGPRQEKFLKKWILQYSNGTIDYRTILMLYRIVINDETSVTRSLAANLKIYLISKLSVDHKDFGRLAMNAVNYMLGTQLKPNTKGNISQGMILHRDKLIRDYLLSYYFVDRVEHCESIGQQKKRRAMCQWNVVFPRTVCRFIRDLMEDSNENHLETLADMYVDSSEEMKSNICFLLGRLHENVNEQRAMLRKYIQKVDRKKSFALYKTIMISLICLRDVDAETEYINLLINCTEYAKDHLRLHCKYYYDNCEYISSRGRYEYTPHEVLRLVVNNTKNSILNGIRRGWENQILHHRYSISLLTDIVTFYTALLSLGKDCMKRDYLEEVTTVCMTIQNSDLIPVELKSYAQNVTFAYELQQKPIQL